MNQENARQENQEAKTLKKQKNSGTFQKIIKIPKNVKILLGALNAHMERKFKNIIKSTQPIKAEITVRRDKYGSVKISTIW